MVPDVVFSVPEALKGFEKFDVDQFEIYIQKSALNHGDDITIDLRGFWIFKSLYPNGLKLPGI